MTTTSYFRLKDAIANLTDENAVYDTMVQLGATRQQMHELLGWLRGSRSEAMRASFRGVYRRYMEL